MRFDDLVKIRKSDALIPRNTYITPVKAFNGFIKDELIFVRHTEADDVIIFRPMDGKEYTLTKDRLKNFKLTGR